MKLRAEGHVTYYGRSGGAPVAEGALVALVAPGAVAPVASVVRVASRLRAGWHLTDC